MRRATSPSPPSGGEGRAALAAKGEGAALSFAMSSPFPSLGFASHFPLPLKGERGFGVPAESDENCSQDAVQVGHHVAIGEAQHAIAALFERSRSAGVVDFASSVAVAVELDDKTLRPSGKISDVRRQDDLALKFHFEPVGAEMIPEAAFRFSEPRPQLFGAIAGFDVPLHASPSPHPLPLKGERDWDVRRLHIPFESGPIVNA